MHEQQATAILHDDQENVELYSKIATVWRLAAKAHIGAPNTYFWETFIQSWTDPLKNIYLKQAITYEQEAEAIAKKDHTTAATLATLAHDLQLNINKRIEEINQREQDHGSINTDIGLGGA